MRGRIIYITGLSGSGKTTIAKHLQNKIPNSILLDGDEVRQSVSKDLGFCIRDKRENIRRNNELIKLLSDQGFVVICAFMASIPEERNKLFTEREVLSVQLTTPLEVCRSRDTKGLYKHYIENLSGVSLPYTPLENPSLSLDTSVVSLIDCVDSIKVVYEEHIRVRVCEE